MTAAPAVAETSLADPQAAGTLMAAACVTDDMNWDEVYSVAVDTLALSGAATLTETAEVAQFGLPTEPNLMATRTVDSLACRLTVPAGDEAYFETLRDAFAAGLGDTYPAALSVPGDTASPHDEKHDWVFSVAGERHFAASLSWQADRGVMLGIGYRQVYE